MGEKWVSINWGDDWFVSSLRGDKCNVLLGTARVCISGDWGRKNVEGHASFLLKKMNQKREPQKN